jgi:hypothetical protein
MTTMGSKKYRRKEYGAHAEHGETRSSSYCHWMLSTDFSLLSVNDLFYSNIKGVSVIMYTCDLSVPSSK